MRFGGKGLWSLALRTSDESAAATRSRIQMPVTKQALPEEDFRRTQAYTGTHSFHTMHRQRQVKVGVTPTLQTSMEVDDGNASIN